MKCSACQHENGPSAKYCEECGTKFARACFACKGELAPTAKFCPECGAPVAGEVPRSGLSPRSIAAYTPKHLADKILQSKSAIEGERKQVTVLFADVKGSMELAEQIDPEQWHQILDRFFQILSEGVHRFEGTVNQYTGDGIMALFGAPIAHEDHAQRACYAALHLREEIARYATDVKRQHGVGFSTRMGINSGDVIVGSIGDDLRMDYTAQGHTVGLAQRMEALASPDTCYVSGATAALVGGYFALDDLGEFQIKGATAPVRVHRLGGIGASRTRFDISRSRGLSCFVGRASDLRTLDDALDQSAKGNSQVVGVVAVAGTGKSRLCFEFLERCRVRGMPVFEARAVAHGSNIPYLPILELLRAYFGITPKDDEHSARIKIAGLLVVIDQRLADALPLLFDFLGVADPAHPAPPLDAEVRQRQLIDLTRQIMRSVSRDQPTVTMIEDLHWLDSASAEFLDQLMDAREDSRSLLLLNFRPEYRAQWMQNSWYRQVPLAPLGREAVAALLASLLGDDAGLAPLLDLVNLRTAGNPFFIEEIAQSLIESGQLIGSKGAYRLVTQIEHLEVPATVQAVLAARIDRLPEREKRLLQVASVIGKDFPEPLLQAVSDLPTDELKAALGILRRLDFIYEQALYPVAEYSFKHPLTQEVALGSQLRERRRQVHATIARLLEAEGSGRIEERAALLAHHWEEAGDALVAAHWHRRAAEWVGLTDFSAGWRHWGRVRTLLATLSDEREIAELRIHACVRLLTMSWRVTADLNEARAIFEEGRTLAQAIGDRRGLTKLSLGIAAVSYGTGDIATYLKTNREIYNVARDLNDLELEANATAWLVDSLLLAARYDEAVTVAADGLARFPRHSPSESWLIGLNPYSYLLLLRGIALCWMGRHQEGLDAMTQSFTMASEDDTPEGKSYGLLIRAEIHYRAGDAAHALADAQEAGELSQKLGDPPTLFAMAQLGFCSAYLAAGRSAEAMACARTALEIHTRLDKAFAACSATLLAEGLLLAGDWNAAQVAAQNAIALSQYSIRQNYEAIAQGVLARALLRRDGPVAREAAEAALTVAATLIARSGARLLAPALDEWRAELANVLGDDVAREQLLRQAEQGYQEIGAPNQAQRLTTQRPTCSG